MPRGPKQLDCDSVVLGCSVTGLSTPPTIVQAGPSIGSGPGNAFFWKKDLEVGDRGKARIDGLGVQAFSIAVKV